MRGGKVPRMRSTDGGRRAYLTALFVYDQSVNNTRAEAGTRNISEYIGVDGIWTRISLVMEAFCPVNVNEFSTWKQSEVEEENRSPVRA